MGYKVYKSPRSSAVYIKKAKINISQLHVSEVSVIRCSTAAESLTCRMGLQTLSLSAKARSLSAAVVLKLTHAGCLKIRRLYVSLQRSHSQSETKPFERKHDERSGTFQDVESHVECQR